MFSEFKLKTQIIFPRFSPDEGTKVISPFGDGDAGHLVGAAVARDGGGGGGGEDSSPSIAGGVSVFVLSGSGRLASVPAEAVFRAKIKKEVRLALISHTQKNTFKSY